VASKKETAHTLKAALELHGVSCFVAHEDIEPTREWQDEIEEALRTMDALAALLSPDFHESKWTDQEVGFAVGTGRLILPIRWGLDPYGFIAKYQGYQLAEGVQYTTVAKDVIKILARHGRTSLACARAMASSLEDAVSWEEAKRTTSLLEECATIDEETLLRVEAAIQNNGQVKTAWGVPDRIEALARRHRHVGNA
jgi:hypothetical protein